MKADDIIKVAREELKKFIVFEGRILCHKINPDFVENGGFSIFNYELDTTPTIGVWLWEDGDSGYTEYHRFHHIEVSDKDEIFVYVENLDGDAVMQMAFNEDSLSTDELYAIASAIEATYKK